MRSRTVRWSIALAVGVGAHVALYWAVGLTRESRQNLRRPSRQFTEVQYFDSQVAERSEAFEQQISLFDPRPLLLPTEWNAANAQRLGDFVQEEAAIFPDFAPVLKAEDQAFFRAYGAPAEPPDAEAALEGFDVDPLRGLGREALAVEASPQDGVELVARDLRTGRALLELTAPEASLDPALRGPQVWEPAALLATFRNGFLTWGLSVARSSGYEEIDARLRDLARSQLKGASGLPDGAYLLEISP